MTETAFLIHIGVKFIRSTAIEFSIHTGAKFIKLTAIEFLIHIGVKFIRSTAIEFSIHTGAKFIKLIIAENQAVKLIGTSPLDFISVILTKNFFTVMKNFSRSDT